MKYAILIYGNEEMDPADEGVMAEYMALSERDSTFGGAELDYPSTATTIRVRDGETLTTDGPFAETKEVLGGFYLIEVPNLDDAIDFAAAVPAARRGGSVEIRPLVAR
ncbi:MAG TPA: YciI family protein [Gaiellaceae bacterium]|nr:YciI family protein [Gaiellaceae bacterium]